MGIRPYVINFESEENVWCISDIDTCLYRLNLKSKVLDEEIQLLDEVCYMKQAFSNIVTYKEFLVMIPGFAKEVVIVNRKDRTKERVKIPEPERRIGTCECGFHTGVAYNHYVYIFGANYPRIVKLNMLNKEISVIDLLMQYPDLTFHEDPRGCFQHYFLRGESGFFPFINTNAVMQFDFKTEEVLIHRVGNVEQRYISIEGDDTYIWLIPRNACSGSILRWNPTDGEVIYYSQYPYGFDHRSDAFYKTVKIDNKILLFAFRGNMNISIDTSIGKLESFPDIYNMENVKGNKYYIINLVGSKIFCMFGQECILWDYASGLAEHFSCLMGENIQARCRREQLKNYFESTEKGLSIVRRENSNEALNALIEYLLLRNGGGNREVNRMSEGYGEVIHHRFDV